MILEQIQFRVFFSLLVLLRGSVNKGETNNDCTKEYIFHSLSKCTVEYNNRESFTPPRQSEISEKIGAQRRSHF